MKNKEKGLSFLLVSVVFIVGLILKVGLAFSLPVYHDVGWYISLLEHHDVAFMNLIVLEHPPLGYYPYLFFLKLFGSHDFVLRFVPLIFGCLQLFLLYYVARKWFGRKTADYSIILSSLLYFAAINNLSPEGDGSIMGFFSLLFFYCVFEYYQAFSDCSKEKKCQQSILFLILGGLFLGILLLIKVRAVLFFVPFFIYSYYKTKNLILSSKDSFIFGIIALLVFAIFPLLVFIANPEPAKFIILLQQVIFHNTATFSLMYKLFHPEIFLQMAVVISFLLVFLFFKGAIVKNDKAVHDKIILLLVWFLSLFFILLFILPEGLSAAYPRYTAFLLPPLLLLCARGFASLPFTNKGLFLMFIAGILLGLFFLLINQDAASYWFFETAAMGIVKVSKVLLVSTFMLSALLLILFFTSRNKIKTYALTLFIILNIGFNILMISDPIVDRTHKNLIDDLLEYYQEHNIKKPVFLWAEDLAFYFDISGRNINLITDPALRTYAESIGYNDNGYYYMRMVDRDSLAVLDEYGGTVFSLYYPREYTLDVESGRKEEYTYLTSHCVLLESFDYAHAKAVIFEC